MKRQYRDSRLPNLRSRKAAWWGGGTVAFVLVAWALCFRLLAGLEFQNRGTLGDMFGTVNALFSGLAFAGVVWALGLQAEGMHEARLTAVREATDKVFQEWWGKPLSKVRHYFFTDFLPNRLPELLADEETSLKTLRGKELKAKELCYWLDKIGWLGACGLIDVDYVLGPMQHVMRRTWLALEPLIERDRKQDALRQLDPVFQFGIEWLFRRSSENARHQMEIVTRRFSNPELRTGQELDAIQTAIEEDEVCFRRTASVKQGKPPNHQ